MTASRVVRTLTVAVVVAEVALVTVALAVGDAADQRGRGRGRAAVAMMTLAPWGWSTGDVIPERHTQAGEEVSPALAWTGAPDDVVSYVLIVHDATVPAGNGTDDLMYWMLWNVPGSTTTLPEGIPSASELADGTRQLSTSGPYYRGPARAANEPTHHVIFDLYALDTMLDVPAVSDAPADTRAAVMAAMDGHIRGRATMVGLLPERR